MFIVLPLHRENFRKMINQGRANRSIKLRVMEMLKEQTCRLGGHGDIKDFWLFNTQRIDFCLKTKEKSPTIFWSITTTSMAA